MRTTQLAAMLAAAALTACAHHHASGAFVVADGAPMTLHVLAPAPTDVTIRFWNAGPGDAHCARTGGHRTRAPAEEGWGYSYRDSALRTFEMTFTSTDRALIGYDVEANGNIEITERSGSATSPSSRPREHNLRP